MQPSKPDHSSAMSIERLHNTAINVVEAICSVIAMPVETLLRPWYGTRYYPPPVVFFASVLMILIPAIAALFGDIVGMIPFSHPARSIGLFDIGSLAKLYFLLAVVHAVRLYRRMVTMSKEQCSTWEGAPLPFFQLIPWCRSFWVTRIVAEPLFILLASTVLQDFFLIQSGLATYLRLAAVALACKQFVSWYRSWEYLRDLMDAKNAGPILARLVENDATEEELSTIHLASFPTDVPPEIRTQAAVSIARAYSPTK
jgi:hypothetical protein